MLVLILLLEFIICIESLTMTPLRPINDIIAYAIFASGHSGTVSLLRKHIFFYSSWLPYFLYFEI